eukprot:1140355-Pelagomonas_calceolata.AAC.8
MMDTACRHCQDAHELKNTQKLRESARKLRQAAGGTLTSHTHEGGAVASEDGRGDGLLGTHHKQA